MCLERLGKLKKFNYLIGIRTDDHLEIISVNGMIILKKIRNKFNRLTRFNWLRTGCRNEICIKVDKVGYIKNVFEHGEQTSGPPPDKRNEKFLI
jgi:hypothetical protein